MTGKFKDEKLTDSQPKSKFSRLHLLAAIFTLFGIGLFVYFIKSVGISEIWEGIGKIGLTGFAVIIFVYFIRIVIRAFAWKLSVYEPYQLTLRDTTSAVIIGEALSSIIPLGILISGTSKAVAVRHRLPLVVGLSSVATENLFYSLITGLFIVFGATVFVKSYTLEDTWVWTIDALIIVTVLLIVTMVVLIVKQWHFLSAICDRLYNRRILRKYLETGRLQVRLFENLIYGFYRRYPQRFLPILASQILYHLLGVFEVWFILTKLSETPASVYSAFLLETVSRTITIVFKLVPFLIGVDEAGAQFVTETLALGAGLGVTLAIIRKGRILFWAIVGVIVITKRGLSVKEIFHQAKNISGDDSEKIHTSEKKIESDRTLTGKMT